MNKNNSENNMGGFYLEKKLRDGNPDLLKRMNDSIAVLNNMLGKYTVRFPGYTDHSMFHSLDIIEYCNEIIGDDQVGKLSPDECYVLMMASYLHDIGMGINNEDCLSFSKVLEKTVPGFIEDSHDEANKVRVHHHEYSALFIDKYSDLFDIPDESLYSEVDVQLFGRVINNLLANANKYNSTGKNISVNVSKEADQIVVEVVLVVDWTLLRIDCHGSKAEHGH